MSKTIETPATLSARSEGGCLIVSVPLSPDKTYTQSGMGYQIASTHGNQQLVVDGKIVNVGLSAYSKIANKAEWGVDNRPKK